MHNRFFRLLEGAFAGTLIIFIFVLAVMIIIRKYLLYQGIFEDVWAWGDFFTVFGIFYSVISGFIFTTVLQRFHSLSETIDEETNLVADIRDFLLYFGKHNEELKREISSALLDYVDFFAGKEWNQMSYSPEEINPDTSPELHQLMVVIHKLEPSNSREEFIFQAIIDRIFKIAVLRAKRINLSKQRLPPQIRIVILLSFIVLIIGVLFLGVRNIFIHGLMVGSIVVVGQIIYSAILDLNHPLWGKWNIDKTLLEILRKNLKDKIRE